MSEKRRRWFNNPFIIALLICLGLLAYPPFTYQTYYFFVRHIDDRTVVVDFDGPERCSREEARDAIEVVKDGFHEDFPYSRLDTVTYCGCGKDEVVFEIKFRPGIMENTVAEADGTAVLWFTCRKTEKGEWEYTGYGSDW